MLVDDAPLDLLDVTNHISSVFVQGNVAVPEHSLRLRAYDRTGGFLLAVRFVE